jgi:hypothetical protein
MKFRLAELENPVRQHGIKLGDVADRKAGVEELKRASLVMRAQSYRRRLLCEFDQRCGYRVIEIQNLYRCLSQRRCRAIHHQRLMACKYRDQHIRNEPHRIPHFGEEIGGSKLQK